MEQLERHYPGCHCYFYSSSSSHVEHSGGRIPSFPTGTGHNNGKYPTIFRREYCFHKNHRNYPELAVSIPYCSTWVAVSFHHRKLQATLSPSQWKMSASYRNSHKNGIDLNTVIKNK